MKSSCSNLSVKKTALVALLVIFLLVVAAGCDADKRADYNSSDDLLAVWQWDNRLDVSYLDFAKENGVSEIYCYFSSFSQKTTDYIASANARGIDVLWLAGKYEWIEDYPSLKEKMQEFIDFQASSPSKFVGIHLDIEPHQHPEFKERRGELISEFIMLTFNLKNDFPSVRTEYDIPFWLDDEITVNGITKPAHEFVIENASRVTVMSYRDNAANILDCADEEIAYAKLLGKPLNLSVETGENDDDIVTFFEEGNEYMLSQLAVVRKQLPNDFGIAIHHIKTWRELKK